ncbi:MAG: hypothetical protein II467_03990, partial [Bacilli bacterium]|nr:hypothetical protein [Bacilli bacterium]
YFVSFTEMDDCVELYIDQPEVPLPTYDYWPAEELVAAGVNFATPVPALDGADEYELIATVDDYDEDIDIYGTVDCRFTDANLAQSKLADYYANLKTLGFTLFDTIGEEEIERYLSPEEDYVVSAEVMDYDGYSVLSVYFDNIVNGQI